eukprot:gene11720-34449_t
MSGIQFDELQWLFALIGNGMTDKGVSQAQSQDPKKGPASVRMVDRSRAHNISIILKGIRMSSGELREALLLMDDSKLSLEQLEDLAKTTPTQQEKASLALYIQGLHPDHHGVDDVLLLGDVERHFLEVAQVPDLDERLAALVYMRSFDDSLAHVKDLAALIVQPTKYQLQH